MKEFNYYPVRVLGCLNTGYLTVIVCPGVGMASHIPPGVIPMQAVPQDLRMPNSEFDVVLEQGSGEFVKVQRNKVHCKKEV